MFSLAHSGSWISVGTDGRRSVPVNMQRDHVPSDITAFAFEFFFWFSRFEFALKENAYLESHSPGAKADPGWREFVKKHEARYERRLRRLA